MSFWKRREVEPAPFDTYFTLAGARAPHPRRPLVPRPVDAAAPRRTAASAPAPEPEPVTFEVLDARIDFPPRAPPSRLPPHEPRPTHEALPPHARPRAAPPAQPRPPHASSFLGHADGITSEWARRLVGPVPPGRIAGKCGNCGTRLAVNAAPRPLRVSCPECGRARVLA